MNCRFLNTVLLSVVCRTGKRKFITTSMATCPKSNEARNVELEIAENLSYPQRQENFPDQLFSSDGDSCETSQMRENLVDASTANVSAEGVQLSKRALKRVQWWFHYFISVV